MSRFLFDIFLNTLLWMPVVASAYVSFIKIRMPDISMETSWAVTGIITLYLYNRFEPALPVLMFASLFFSFLLGLITYFIFRISNGQKLLSGLIAYFFVMALGYRILGNDAIIEADFVDAQFGFSSSQGLASACLLFVIMIMFLSLLYWERSTSGVRARIIGQTMGASARFLGFRSSTYYFLTISLAAICAGFGGSLYSIYYGQASNAIGIGLLVKALFGVLAGEKVLSLLRQVSRPTVFVIPVGSFVFSLVFVVAQEATFILQGLRDTDKTAFIGFLLLLLLLSNRKAENKTTGAYWW